MNKALWALAVVAGVGCGEADSVADIASEGFASEEEVGTTGDALLSNAASVWLPMQSGNTWTLESSSGATRTVRFSNVGRGIGWLEGLSPNGQWAGLASSAPNTLFAWDPNARQWDPMYRFGYAYTSWRFGFSRSPCETFVMRRTATDEVVSTPAGSFTGARTIGYSVVGGPTVRCAPPQLESVTFAPGVGVIALVTGKGERFVLTGATVNGRKFPAGAVTSKLVFDQPSYTNRSNTIVCITTPCPGNAVNATAQYTYTITNGTTDTRVWQFSTGCQYDLTLSDSNGKVVRALSEGRFCTQALTNITLAPGASKTFTGSIELTDRDGLQLDGTYTAKAFLGPRLGVVATPVAAASATVTVDVVPAIP